MFGNVVPLDNFKVKIHGEGWAYDFHGEHCIGNARIGVPPRF